MFRESISPMSEPAVHRFDPGALLAASMFGALAVIGLLGKTMSLNHELRWMLPLLLLGTGVALLVSAVTRRREPARPSLPLWPASAGEHSSGDEVGAERGEDGEVEQTGGGHDG